MRAVDADELKKCAIPCEIHNGALTDLCVPLYQIDNAPTVEERPQGEWKLVSNINNDIDVVCPFCSKTRIFSYAHGYSIEEVKSQLQEVNDLPNYCENCGVEMKGGAE